MKAFADSQALVIETSTLACGSESMPHEISRLLLATSRIELVTLGGAVWNIDAWWPLIARSSAVVLMLDSQSVRESADREHITALAAAPNCPRLGCLVWTKDDLVTTHGLEKAVLAVGDVLRAPGSNAPFRANSGVIATWPSFSTRMDVEDAMLAPIGYLVTQLTEAHAREDV
jgi:hypothetical protein